MSQQIGYAANSLNSDNSYFNFWVRNDTDYEQRAGAYNAERDGIVLKNMEDYTVSVVRFKIPAQAIPLFTFEDNTYTFTWATSADGGQTFSNAIQATVQWNPLIANSFTTPKGLPYTRFVYYYWQMLSMINRTLQSLMATAVATPAFAAILGAVTEWPRLQLDAPSDPFLRWLLPLTAPGGSCPFATAASQTPAPPAAQIGENKIYMFANPKLFAFLAGFNSKYIESGATIGGVNVPEAVHMFEFLNKDFSTQASLPALDGIPARPFLFVPQDYSCLHLWQRLSRLLITTDMPVQSEEIGVSGEGGLPFTQSLLTDFEIQPDQVGTQRQYIYFYPQGDLRQYNFSGNGVLRKMSVRVFYQLDDLSLVPVMLPPGFEMTIKLQFQRRLSSEILSYTTNQRL